MIVSWITPSEFIDVDLPIVAELQKSIDIYWQIIVGKLSDDIKHYLESQLKDANNVCYEFVERHTRVYDLRTLALYCKVLKRANKVNPDLYYTSLQTAPFGPVVYKLYWPLERTVTACHNVSTPKGANREYYARFYTFLTLCAFKNIQVFSLSQKDILLSRFPAKNVLYAPLAIKDFGKPTKPLKTFDEKMIIFLFFGIISPYKRLDLLIKAAQNIYERGYHGFKVKIAGNCKNWDYYASLIQYPHLFDNRIEHIPNSEVADLFAECDYFIMPYQDIAQSGAITVAYRYNLPIILSNLPQFSSFAEDGKTGYFFQKDSIEDLEKKMIQVIEGGKSLFESLRGALQEFVQERYSTPSIASKYLSYFENLLNH